MTHEQTLMQMRFPGFVVVQKENGDVCITSPGSSVGWLVIPKAEIKNFIRFLEVCAGDMS